MSAAHVGDPADAMGNASQVLEMEYEVPLQAHAAMEPLSATASVTPDRCEVWAPTQIQDGAMMVAMGVTETAPRKNSYSHKLTLEEALDERLTLIISLLHWWPPRY